MPGINDDYTHSEDNAHVLLIEGKTKNMSRFDDYRQNEDNLRQIMAKVTTCSDDWR